MKTHKLFFALLLLCIVSLSACRKSMPHEQNPLEMGHYHSTWAVFFESFWTEMNYKYSFWETDPTDWDGVYTKYKPLFAALDADPKGDEMKPYELMRELSSTLIDHHLYIQIMHPTSKNKYIISPGYDEVSKREYFHENNYDEFRPYIQDAYENSGRITNKVEGSLRVTDNSTLNIESYVLDNNIAYMYFNQFALSEIMGDEYAGLAVRKAYDNFFKIIESTTDLKGVIIDVRGNGGGYIFDMNHVLSKFIKEETTIGYTRSKSGLGRLDFSPWTPYNITPGKESKYADRNVPLVLLVDIHSVSMSEMTAMGVQRLKNGCVIGERTYGGHGPLRGSPNDYAGTFGDKNAMLYVYTSSSPIRTVDGQDLEGIGITPDIESLWNNEQAKKNIDTQLDRAAQYIKTGE